MHRLLLSILLIAGFCGLAAVPYAKVWSTETLFPSSTPSTTSSTTPVPFYYDWFQHGKIKADTTPVQPIKDDVDDTLQPDAMNGTVSEQPINMDDNTKHSGDHPYGPYVPAGSTDEHTLVRRSNLLAKRGTYRGTIQMNCRKAPMVCKNAGYHQNCLRGARGNYKTVRYTNGPDEDKPFPEAKKNRYNSGVSTGWATPCNARPFSQISYDRWWDDLNNPPYNENVGHQTDEWPMATMKTGPFNNQSPTSPFVQVSLRCMNNDNNNAESNQVMDFRRCRNGYVLKGPHGEKGAMVNQDGTLPHLRSITSHQGNQFQNMHGPRRG